MNENLSNVIEAALKYASPLPLQQPSNENVASSSENQSATSHDLDTPTEVTHTTTDFLGGNHGSIDINNQLLHRTESITTQSGSELRTDHSKVFTPPYSATDNKLSNSDNDPLFQHSYSRKSQSIVQTVLTIPLEEIDPYIDNVHSFSSTFNLDNTISTSASQTYTSESIPPLQNTEPMFGQSSSDTQVYCPVSRATSMLSVPVKDADAQMHHSEDIETPNDTLSPDSTEQPKVKRRRREKYAAPTTETILPPCMICEEKSSGYHYGANTCEACKGFFRRTLKKKEVRYKCKCKPEERSCWKQGPYKNGCPACRYERCLDVGMSKNAIKIGRYTVDHKTNNIKVVNGLKEQDLTVQHDIDTDPVHVATPTSQTNAQSTPMDTSPASVGLPATPTSAQSTPMGASSDSVGTPTTQTSARLTPIAASPASVATTSEMSDENSIIDRAFFSACYSSPGSGESGVDSPAMSSHPLLTNEQGMMSVGSPSMPSSSGMASHNSNSTLREFMTLAKEMPSTSEPAIKKKPLTETIPDYIKAGLSLKEIDTIVKTLTEMHCSTQFIDEIPTHQIKKRHNDYLERYKLKTQLFGKMNTSTAEFMEFYKQTGMDLDGRMEDVKTAFSHFEKKVALLVSFGKAIPEFKKLCLDDQANLIKSSRLENTLIGGYRQITRNINMQKKVLISPWGKEFHFEEMERYFPIWIIEERFYCAQRLIQLDLSPQEEAVIRAIVILFTDRCQLKEPEKVASIQEKMIFCLQYLLNVRHGGPGTMFYKIFNLIVDLRTLTEHDAEYFVKKMTDQPLVSETLDKFILLREFLS